MLSAIERGNSHHPLIVFLHGFLGQKEDFLPLAEKLSTDYYCVLIDLPGHGQSIHNSFDSYIEFENLIVEKVLSYSSTSIHWIGYSLGARLALQLINKLPTKSTTLISAKVLPLSKNEQKLRKEFEEKILSEMHEDFFGHFIENWYSQTLFKTLKNNPPLLKELIEKRKRQNPNFMRKVFQLTSSLSLPSPFDDLSQNACPLLYFAGEEDVKYTKEASDLFKSYPKALIHMIPNASHSLHTEKAEALLPPIQTFLKELT